MSLLSWFASRNSARVLRPRRQPNVRLSLERLEERCVPSANFGSALAFGSHGGSPNATLNVATDSAGDVYVDGRISGTTAVNFAPAGANPVTLNPANYGNNSTGYIAKYTAGEQQLLWVIPTTSGTDWNSVYAMAVDGAGNAYATVYDITTRVTTLNKYDPNGNLLWSNNLTQSVSTANDDGTTGIALDSSGNVYVTGFPSGVNWEQKFVAKFSGTNGNLVWNETYNKGSTYANSESTVAVDASGNVYLTGTYQGKSNFNPNGTYDLTSFGSKKAGYAPNAYVLKLNTNGNFLWAGSMGTDTNTTAGGIKVDGTGNVYLAGRFSLGNNNNDFDPGPGVALLPGGTSYLVKLDTKGDYVWGDGWNNVDFSFSNTTLTLDSAGNVYLTGFYTGSANFNPGSGQNVLTAAAGTNQAFVLNLDNGGNFVWVAATSSSPATIAGSGSQGYSVAVDTAGNVATAGEFSIPTNFNPGSGTYTLTPNGYNPSNGQPAPNGFLWGLTQTSLAQPLRSAALYSSNTIAPNNSASPSVVSETSAFVSTSDPGAVVAGAPATSGDLATTSAMATASPSNLLDQLFVDPHRLSELQWWAAAVGFDGNAKHDLTA